MLIRRIAAATALALIGLASAAPEPERPRIYFPREPRREYGNATIPGTDKVDPVTDTDKNAPADIPKTSTSLPVPETRIAAGDTDKNAPADIPKTSTSLPVPETRIAAGDGETPASNSDHIDHTPPDPPPPTSVDLGNPVDVDGSPSGNASSPLPPKNDTDDKTHLKPSDGDPGIVIAPTGIVAPTGDDGSDAKSKLKPDLEPKPNPKHDPESQPPLNSGPGPEHKKDDKPDVKQPIENVVPTGEKTPSGDKTPSHDGKTTSPPEEKTPSAGPAIVHPDPVVAPTGGATKDVLPKIGSPETPKQPVGDVPDKVPETATNQHDDKSANPVLVSPDSSKIVPGTGATARPTVPKPGDVPDKPDDKPVGPVRVSPDTDISKILSGTGSTARPTGSNAGDVPEIAPKIGTEKNDDKSGIPVLTPPSGSDSSSGLDPTARPQKPSPGDVADTTSKSPTVKPGEKTDPDRPGLAPPESITSGHLPGANPTAPPTEQTIPPPIAVLPTGSSPSIPIGHPTDNPTPPPSVDDDAPPAGSKLPEPEPSLVTPDAPVNSTVGAPESSDRPIQVPADPVPTEQTSPVNPHPNDETPEIPVVNSTIPESQPEAPTDHPSIPAIIPPVNGSDPTRPPKVPDPLPPSNGADDPDPTDVSTELPPVSTKRPVKLPPSQPTSVPNGEDDAPKKPSRPEATTSKLPSKPDAPPPEKTPLPPPRVVPTPVPVPSNVPNFFSPVTTVVSPDSVNITIRFQGVFPDSDLWTTFGTDVVNMLPSIIRFALGLSDKEVHMLGYKGCQNIATDSKQVTTTGDAIAFINFPNDKEKIKQLKKALADRTSLLYVGGQGRVEDWDRVTKMIDPDHDIMDQSCMRGGVDGGQSPNGPGGPTDGGVEGGSPRSKPPPDSDVFQAAPQAQTHESGQRTTIIVTTAVGVSALYGAAMFVIARRYKRRKRSHRRSDSVTNSQSQGSSEMRYTAGGSPVLMGGALLSREYFSYGAGGRDSAGSGRSGMGNSGRTANISAPVAAENSLGWN